ncbi:MAG: hypothetical protein K8L91_27880 [Anaerolineae bacterium]|nr:hypothetical protein [Anaerolineae bacterium]
MRSQDSAPKRIESDHLSVARAGNWTSQAASQASGGRYLYSSGADDDVLTLQFSGPSIEVIFVAGPSLGTLAVEVDDIVLRTVITTADQTAYQQSSRIDYLSDEPHTLKVYAQAGGVVGVDAFVIPTPNLSLLSGEGNATGQPRDPFCAPTNQIHRVSLISMSGEANLSSSASKLSADGRYVVYASDATNLFTGDNNASRDIFVYDRMTCTTSVVSVSSTGAIADGNSNNAAISGDGRYVAFDSLATNLVSGDTNGEVDVFVHDRQTHTTTRVSVATGGIQSTGGFSRFPAISADGRYVAFDSLATNLVSGDTNVTRDVFVRDLQTGTTIRVSVASDGTQANSSSYYPQLSADGRYVSFTSNATNLVTNDTNGLTDTFVHDCVSNTTTRVSVATGGTQAVLGYSMVSYISGDGRYVAFDSTAGNLVPDDTNGETDIFVHDRTTNTTSRISVADDGAQSNGASIVSSISADGRFVGFDSQATNLVLYDTNGTSDSFIHDQSGGNTTRVSVSAEGAQGWGGSISISGDGRYVSFTSNDPYLVTGDTNNSSDVFVAPVNPLFIPSNLAATTISQSGIQLVWTDNASDETNYGIERSPNDTSGWSQIGSTVANVASFTDTVYLACGTTYYYRVRSYRSGDGVFSGYSNITHANTAPCRPDALALVSPTTRSANLIHTLTNPPAGGDYSQFATGFPYGTGGQYVTGDWNGDGLDTLGVYWNGAFFFTNDFGTGGTWGGIWFGLGGQPVVGRFDATINHDCLGVTDSGTWTNGDTFFALYFTCNLTSGPTPPLTFQWLSILLPNSQGFTGTFQFVAGDFNGDGVDSVAVRRGAFIAWTNIPPTTLLSQFNLAQYIGAPGTGDEGKVVAGDWDRNNVDSFGLVYQNGTFYRRNDVEWNTGVYILQTFTPSVGTPFDVASWRPN